MDISSDKQAKTSHEKTEKKLLESRWSYSICSSEQLHTDQLHKSENR